LYLICLMCEASRSRMQAEAIPRKSQLAHPRTPPPITADGLDVHPTASPETDPIARRNYLILKTLQ
jgi:hypothetical protein